MKALGASHLKVFVSRQREKERVAFALSRHEFGFPIHQKRVGDGLLLFRSNCVGSISPASSAQTNIGSEEIQTVNSDQPKTVRVRFKLHKECAFGQQFLVVGDDPNLGLWDPSDGVPLNWSEGHVWTAEVEMPISKMISYKFILKEITGTVSWQPGPDRILETWDTAKTISVSEDWDSPDFQNIVEEELLVVDDLNESSLNDLGLLIAGNLNQSRVGEGNDAMNEQVGDNEHTSDHSDESSTLMVAENINNEESGEQDSSMSDKGPGLMSEGQEETTLGDHNNSPSLKNETGLVLDEGIPVLVPGLATIPPEVVEAEEVKPEAKNIVRTTTTTSDETVEASTTDLIKEKKINIIVEDTTTESDETEAATEPEIRVSASMHCSERSEMMVAEDKPQLNGKKQMESKILEIDMQWGRRTLQKFLANLGFMQHS
ncbi:hypothetical protein C2S51_034856 [Perilla frutescens var. frutescens]|nr:hypothetical protein C2S51_034856 [Perilla frutescens var. frutescens]